MSKTIHKTVHFLEAQIFVKDSIIHEMEEELHERYGDNFIVLPNSLHYAGTAQVEMQMIGEDECTLNT